MGSRKSDWRLGFVSFFALYSAFRLSIHPWVRDLYSYYVYPLIPFLIYFLKTGTTWIQKRNDKRTILWILLAFFLTVYRNTKENDYPIPLSPESDRAAELEKILEQIPPNVDVSAGFHISPFISLKNSVYPIRETRDWKEWIVLDLRYNSPYLSSEKILQRMESDLRSGKLRWVQRTDRFGLLRRDQPESETKTEIKIRAKTQP